MSGDSSNTSGACERCSSAFTIFKRKKICSVCKQEFCQACLSRQSRNGTSERVCEVCTMLSSQNTSIDECMKYKTKHLRCYLTTKNIPIASCKEKRELAELIVHSRAIRQNTQQQQQQQAPRPQPPRNQPPPPQPPPQQQQQQQNQSTNNNGNRTFNDTLSNFMNNVQDFVNYNINMSLNRNGSGSGGSGDGANSSTTRSSSHSSSRTNLNNDTTTNPPPRGFTTTATNNSSNGGTNTSSSSSSSSSSSFNSNINNNTNTNNNNTNGNSNASAASSTSFSSNMNDLFSFISEQIPPIVPIVQQTFTNNRFTFNNVFNNNPNGSPGSTSSTSTSAHSSPEPMYQQQQQQQTSASASSSSTINGSRTNLNEEQQQPPPQSNIRRRASISDLRTEEDIETLSVKQMKEILASNFVEYSGCFEKKELMDRVRLLYRSHVENRLIEDNMRQQETTPTPTTNSNSSSSTNLLSESSTNIPKKASEDDLCKICMESLIDCVLLECAHMVSCTKCGKRLAECPICRANVVRVVRVFKP